jgi:anti-sigma regulatory factor (Ser/Thr protein kinase)
MHAYMDEVVYNSRGNEVRMLKRISSSQSRQAG